MSTTSKPTSNSRPSASPLPPRSNVPQGVNTQHVVIDAAGGRLLAVADIRGLVSRFNELALETGAKAIIHTGDFGFFESSSLSRINDRTLRHLIMYSPLIQTPQRNQLLAAETTPSQMRQILSNAPSPLLSEFPLLLSGKLKLNVPVFTVWGACEDVAVLEKFRSGQYDVENLHVLDEATTRSLDIGGIKLRLLGLGGAFVPHRMFDNGEGQATIAGGQGTMWTTALQIGELVDTSQKVYDPSETRLLVTHASPGREGMLAQLALVVRADLTISGGLHFRYSSSYNEFSVQSDLDGYRQKLLAGKDSFERIYDSVKAQVDAVIDDNQRVLLEKAIMVAERVLPGAAQVPAAGGTTTGEEPAWKNCWNWNLCDAAYGSLVLDIKEGRISAELRSQGFNFAYRKTAAPAAPTATGTPQSQASGLPAVTGAPPKQPTPSSSTPAPAITTPAKSPAPSQPTTSTTPALAATSAPTESSTTSTPPPKPNGTPIDKKDKKKDKKDKREKDGEKKDGPGPATPANAAAGSAAAQTDGEPTSDGGARTPTSKKPPRNPYTLFMKVPPATTEVEIRDFFNDAKEGITKLNYPPAHAGRPHRIVYVEFGDEEAMKAGQAKHSEKIGDFSPHVVVAEDRGHTGGPGFRGGRGGGRGGGFASRAFGQAGLTRKNTGGDE